MPIKLEKISSYLLFVFTLTFNVSIIAHADIVPQPQEIKEKFPEYNVTLDSRWRIAWDWASNSADRIKFIAQELSNDLHQRNIQVSLIDLKSLNNFERTIIIGDPFLSNKVAAILQRNGISLKMVPDPNIDSRFQEGYLLDVCHNSSSSDDMIMIAAASSSGLYYGSRTLLQLIDSDKKAKGVRIIDYPDTRWRGVYLNFKHLNCFYRKRNMAVNNSSTECIANFIKKYAELKLNRIVFRGHLFHQLDDRNLEILDKVFEECRKRFIEPIPSLESKLENLPPYRNKPPNFMNYLEGVFISNAQFVVGETRILQPASSYSNSIKNGSFESDIDANGFPDQWNTRLSVLNNNWKMIEQDEGATRPHSGVNAVGVCNDRALSWDRPGLLSKSGMFNGRIQQDVTVTPDSYYQMGFWGKSDKIGSRIRVYVLQYNRKNQLIRKRNYQRLFSMGPRWKKHYLPIFSDVETNRVRVIFESVKGVAKADVYLDDVEMVRLNGSLINVADPIESGLVVKNAVTGKKLSLNEDYLFKKAKLSTLPQSRITDLEKAQIEILPASELSPGDMVTVSYDSKMLNPREKHSKRCPSAAGTYTEYRNLFEKLLQLSPNYININMDEYRGGYNRDSRCLKRKLSNAEIYADFVTKLNNILHKRGDVEVLSGIFIPGLGKPDIKLMLWDDMVNYWHNGGGKRGREYQLRYGGQQGETYLSLPAAPFQKNPSSEQSRYHIPKNVILAVWWYRPTDKWKKISSSPEYYENRGYQYVVCTWDNLKNIALWSKEIHGRNSLGMMGTTFENRKGGVTLTADYAWKNVLNR